jgi:hypothetical protein
MTPVSVVDQLVMRLIKGLNESSSIHWGLNESSSIPGRCRDLPVCRHSRACQGSFSIDTIASALDLKWGTCSPLFQVGIVLNVMSTHLHVSVALRHGEEGHWWYQHECLENITIILGLNICYKHSSDFVIFPNNSWPSPYFYFSLS